MQTKAHTHTHTHTPKHLKPEKTQVAIGDTATHKPQHAKGPKYQYKTHTNTQCFLYAFSLCAIVCLCILSLNKGVIIL
jgi:hypothetical protein